MSTNEYAAELKKQSKGLLQIAEEAREEKTWLVYEKQWAEDTAKELTKAGFIKVRTDHSVLGSIIYADIVLAGITFNIMIVSEDTGKDHNVNKVKFDITSPAKRGSHTKKLSGKNVLPKTLASKIKGLFDSSKPLSLR